MDDSTARMNPPGRLKMKSPRKKPMNEPARPSRIVMPMPRGSGPGSSTRATAPTMRPSASRPRMLTTIMPSVWAGCAGGQAEELLQKLEEIDSLPGRGRGSRRRRRRYSCGLLTGQNLDRRGDVGKGGIAGQHRRQRVHGAQKLRQQVAGARGDTGGGPCSPGRRLLENL